MDEVYQVLVDVAPDKALIHLEPFTVVLPPEITTEVIWIEDDLPPYEFLHHPSCQVITDTNSQPVNIRECQ